MQKRHSRPTTTILKLLLVATLLGGLWSSAHDEEALAPPVLLDAPARLFGAFTYGGVWQGFEPVLELERSLGFRLDIVHWYMNWDHSWDPALVERAAQAGRRPLLSWQPHRQSPAAIAAGDYDDTIRSWAEGAAAFGGIFYLRPFPEMNGDWVTWNGDPEALVEAWRRMVGIFREEGADNVRWVWAPNITDSPRTQANKFENYYPGADYVDVLALDGFNWGTTQPWSSWRSFDDIFAVPYARLAALGSQPIWITEVASVEEGGEKGTWVREMLSSAAFPRLEAVVWFDENKRVDWRIRSTLASLDAFRDRSNTDLAGRP